MRRRQELAARAETEQSTEAIRGRCQSLAGFVKEAWHVVEPTARLVWNWHLDALCDHLEAITFGRLPRNRLLVNVPPGSSKSLIVSVMWQAWEWGPCGLSSMRFLATAFNDGPVKRDSRKCRDLILSEWFLELWPEIELVRFGEMSFANSNTGTREGVSFGSLTSQRGDRLLIDDPHSTETAESEAERLTTTRKFREGATNRLNDQEKSAIVVIMQRLHVMDVTGVIQQLGMDYEFLCLPMEFEPERRCRTSIGFVDPRTEEGELLDPVRFPRTVVEDLKRDMGFHAYNSQYQQRPTIREGGMFQRDKATIIQVAPVGTRWVRYFDLAATKEKVHGQPQGAFTCGVLLGKSPSGRFVIGHVVRERFEGHGVRRLIKSTAASDATKYGDVEIGVPQDPGQAGKTQAQDMILMLAGYTAFAQIESGDKTTRAEPLAAQWEAGNVDMIEGGWNEAFLDELCDFPGSKFKDHVDASSGAFTRLVGDTVFDTSEEDFVMDAVTVQSIWTRSAAIEMDKDLFAGLWSGYHRQTDTIYIYDEMVARRGQLAVHAEAMRKRGKWIPVLFDLEGKKRKKEEGALIAQHLVDLEVDIFENALDSIVALDETETRLRSGRLKIFSHLNHLLAEYRRYRRNEKGEIVEKDDLLMRCLSQVVMAGRDVAVSENRARSDEEGLEPEEFNRGTQSASGY